MPQTANYALPYPSLTDPPNVPGDIQALAARMEVVMPLAAVTSTSAVTSPVNGQVVFALDTLRMHRYTGSSWVPLNPNMPAAVLINTQAQATTSGVDTFVQLDTIEEQTTIGGNAMAAAGTSIDTTGERRCGITRNNSSAGYSLATSVAYTSMLPSGNGSPQGNGFECTGCKRLAVGDVLRPVATQSSSGTRWIESSSVSGNTGGGPTRFWAYKIRD